MTYGDNRDLTWEITEAPDYEHRKTEYVINFISNLRPPPATVIDVGVRDGYSTEYFKKLGYDALGTDILDGFIKHAQERGRNVIFDDMVHTKINKKFDIVFSRHSLEHVAHPIRFVTNCINLMGDDALLVIIVPLESKSSFYFPRKRQKHLCYFPTMDYFKRRFMRRFELKEIIFKKTRELGIKTDFNEIFFIGKK